MSVLIGNEVLENSLEGYGARGTLASDPTTGTTLTLTTGHGARFPEVLTGQRLRLQCEDELMDCTAHTAAADTFTVTRGVESTDNVAHDALAPVNAVVTAGLLKQMGGHNASVRFKTAKYYSAPYYSGPDAGGAYGANRHIWAPFYVFKTTTFDRIACGITVLHAANTVDLFIHLDDNTVKGGPKTLLLNAGTVDASTTGYKEITISQELTPGLYWLGLRASSGTIAVRRSTIYWNPFGSATIGIYNWPYLDASGAIASVADWTENGNLAAPFIQLRAA